jgi:hypothetical protein
MSINNTPLYDAVIAAIGASNQAWLTDPVPGNYLTQANVAVAVASEVDSLISPIDGGGSISQRLLMESIVKSVMAGRFPTSIDPNQYSDVAHAIAAAFNSYSTKIENDVTGSSGMAFTNIGASVPFSVVRQVGADSIDLATGDIPANEADTLGVFDGAQVIPFHQNPIANFDTQPIIGAPCKLDPTIAGKLTSTFLVGESDVPYNIIATKDYSNPGLGIFRAQVGINYGVSGIVGSQQQFLADAVRLTGADPRLIHVTAGCDYLPTEMTNVGAGPVKPLSGNSDLNGIGSKYSIASFNIKLHVYEVVLPNTGLTQCAWALRYRYRLTDPLPANSQITLELLRTTPGNYGDVIGIASAPLAGSDMYFYWANAGVSMYAVGLLPATKRLLNVFDNNWHSGIIWTTASGTFDLHILHDSQAQFDATLAPGVVAASPQLLAYGKGLDIDYFEIASGT